MKKWITLTTIIVYFVITTTVKNNRRGKRLVRCTSEKSRPIVCCGEPLLVSEEEGYCDCAEDGMEPYRRHSDQTQPTGG